MRQCQLCGKSRDSEDRLCGRCEKISGDVMLEMMTGPGSRTEEVVQMDEKEELAKRLIELLRTDGAVRSAVFDLVCSCPNLVVQY